MKNKSIWLMLVIFALAFALHSLYPPTNRDLIEEFSGRAVNPGTNLVAAAARAQTLAKEAGLRPFVALRQAIGTNDIRPYFPFVNTASTTDPTLAILQRLQRDSLGRIKLGLDLQGGMSFLVAMDTNQLATAEGEGRQRALEQAVEVLRKRVDQFGVAEPIIQPQGENRILIQLPGLSEEQAASARRTIERAAFLEFRIVHPQSEQLLSQGLGAIGYTNLTGRIKRSGKEQVVQYLVRRSPEKGLTGKNVKNSGVFFGDLGNEPKIHLSFDNEGGSKFAEITRANVGERMAIVLDGEVYSAPVIQSEILQGSCEISGSFDLKEAFELSNILMNPLEAPVQIVAQNTVDPSLGADSIRSGVKAAIMGTIAVSVFMLVYYLLAGLIANFALVLNIIILLGVLCSFDVTLTLPGIAGIVLTVGMAVDANVLIYERIREELAAGKSMRGALSAGYSRAFGTIFDSNLTTLIASVILILMGTGPVKGFGWTLTIGVTVSMFSALVVTRLIFDFLLDRGWLKSLPMLALIKGTHIDFMKYAVPAFVLSWSLILVGLGYGIHRGHKVMGVDFAGGDRLTLGFDQAKEVPLDQLRAAIATAGVGDVGLGYQRDLSTGLRTLSITSEFNTDVKIRTLLQERFPEAKFQQLQSERVGAVVGAEVLKSAIIAAMLAMFGILVYVAFRYEFSFAVGAVVAIIHDILMTMGWFFLSGRELSAPIVAAILTIIGFSINDTIVIFDRIREDLRLGLRGSFRELMNHALNRTLSRTIITSGTVFLATLMLYLYGGSVINDFAFTFLVGIITGTYSSIYIASALVLWWHKGQRPSLASQVTVENTAAVRA